MVTSSNTTPSLQKASMAAAGDTQLPTARDIKREVTAVLRGADDANLLTFKQVNKSCQNEIPRNSRLNTRALDYY